MVTNIAHVLAVSWPVPIQNFFELIARFKSQEILERRIIDYGEDVANRRLRRKKAGSIKSCD